MIQLTIHQSYLFIILIVLLNTALGYLIQFSRGYLRYGGFLLQQYVLVVLSGFRYGIGTDYFSYKEIFDTVPNGHFEIEPFFRLSNIILKGLFGNFQSLVLITSLITIILVNYVIIKNVDHYGLASFLYVSLWFYFIAWNLVRQFWAISMLMAAYNSIMKKRNFAAFFFMVVAILCHYSSILWIIVFLVILSENHLLFALLLVFLLGSYFRYDFFIGLIPSISKYRHYFLISEVINYKALIYNLGLLIPFMFLNKSDYHNKNLRFSLELAVIGLVFLFLSTKNMFLQEWYIILQYMSCCVFRSYWT